MAGCGAPAVFSLYFQQNTAAELSFAAEILGFPAVGRVENSKTVRCSLLVSAVLVDACDKLKYRFPQDGFHRDWKLIYTIANIS